MILEFSLADFTLAPDLSSEYGPSLAFAKNTTVLQSDNHASLVLPSITPRFLSFFLQYFDFYFVFLYMVKIACLPKLGSELIETQPRFYIKKERKGKVMIIYNKIYGASRLPKTSENDCFAVYMVIETVATRKVQMKNKQANEQKATKHILIVILVTLF